MNNWERLSASGRPVSKTAVYTMGRSFLDRVPPIVELADGALEERAASEVEVLAENKRLRLAIHNWIVAVGRSGSNRDDAEIQRAAEAIVRIAMER